jgi:hypothetical protein
LDANSFFSIFKIEEFIENAVETQNTCL